MAKESKNKFSDNIARTISIFSFLIALATLFWTESSINGASIEYVPKKENAFKINCVENSDGLCKNWPEAKLSHFDIELVLKNTSLASGYIKEVKLYPCVPKLYPLNYDVYRIDQRKISFLAEISFSFRVGIEIPM